MFMWQRATSRHSQRCAVIWRGWPISTPAVATVRPNSAKTRPTSNCNDCWKPRRSSPVVPHELPRELDSPSERSGSICSWPTSTPRESTTSACAERCDCSRPTYAPAWTTHRPSRKRRMSKRTTPGHVAGRRPYAYRRKGLGRARVLGRCGLRGGLGSLRGPRRELGGRLLAGFLDFFRRQGDQRRDDRVRISDQRNTVRQVEIACAERIVHLKQTGNIGVDLVRQRRRASAHLDLVQ